MDITWLGENSFKINDDIIDVLVNPNKNTFDKSSISESTLIVETDQSSDLDTNQTKVNSPGEYEINNASIHGVANSIVKDQDRSISTCYKIESRGLSIAVIGMIGSSLDSEALSVLSSSHAVVRPLSSTCKIARFHRPSRSAPPRRHIAPC